MKYKSQEEKNSAYFINQATSPKSSYPYTGLTRPKGLAKLGKIVAETLLRMQMFPSLAARETCVAETNFAARQKKKNFAARQKQKKNVFAWRQKHFCFPDTNFASETETHVSQLSHPGKHSKKHCSRNNVS